MAHGKLMPVRAFLPGSTPFPHFPVETLIPSHSLRQLLWCEGGLLRLNCYVMALFPTNFKFHNCLYEGQVGNVRGERRGEKGLFRTLASTDQVS